MTLVWIGLIGLGVIVVVFAVAFVSLAGSGLRGGEYEPPGGSHDTDHKL